MDLLKFDTPRFIAEIEKRPAIWRKCEFHLDYSNRLQQWSEMVEIYKGNDNLTSSEYDKLEQQLRHKWRNIRDSFVKTHKAKMKNLDPMHNKKPFYAFYNNLLFLARDYEGSDTSVIKRERKSDNDSGSDPDCSSYSWRNKRAKTSYIIEQTETDPLNVLSENGNAPVSLCQGNAKPVFAGQENAKHVQKERNLLEEDDDRLFFLSLVKEFKKIPDQKQIQTKLDILKIIQNAQR